ncbi:MAG: hypothetical protein QXG51_06365 [Nitrososphaerota archaeon]
MSPVRTARVNPTVVATIVIKNDQGRVARKRTLRLGNPPSTSIVILR